MLGKEFLKVWHASCLLEVGVFNNATQPQQMLR